MPTFSQRIRNLLMGNPFGEVFPPKAPPPPLAINGRTAALHVLRDYITDLTFYRVMAPGQPPTPFKIQEENFHIEWPDSTSDLVFPSIAIIPAPALYNAIGLVSYIEEDTRDLFAPGTVVQWQAEYEENIKLEIWASKSAERRAIIAGLEIALTPTEQMSGIRFYMPEYFNEPVCFILNGITLMDDIDAARNRRRAQLDINMRLNIVALVNYTTLAPSVQVNTDVDQDTNLPVSIP